MSVFAKVVYPNALNKYFRNDGCDDTGLYTIIMAIALHGLKTQTAHGQ